MFLFSRKEEPGVEVGLRTTGFQYRKKKSRKVDSERREKDNVRRESSQN